MHRYRRLLYFVQIFFFLKATLRGFLAKLNQTLLMFKHEPDLKIIVQYMGVFLLLNHVSKSAYFGYLYDITSCQ